MTVFGVVPDMSNQHPDAALSKEGIPKHVK
jgi:hypothetical protein